MTLFLMGQSAMTTFLMSDTFATYKLPLPGFLGGFCFFFFCLFGVLFFVFFGGGLT